MTSVQVDSAYSWVVAFICCGLSFLMVGLPKISGLFFVEMMPHFNVSRKDASFPIFLFSITRSLTGLLAGYFGHKFGIKIVMLSGCIIASLGAGACFFATNIVTIYILWGGVIGLGCGLTASLTIQAINIYFKKHFSTGNGISASGVSLGGLVLSPIAAIILKKYGVLGSFLILCGILLHGIPLCMMLKAPKGNQKSKTNHQKKLTAESEKNFDMSKNEKGKTINQSTADNNLFVIPVNENKLLEMHCLNEMQKNSGTYQSHQNYGSFISKSNFEDFKQLSAVDINKAIFINEINSVVMNTTRDSKEQTKIITVNTDTTDYYSGLQNNKSTNDTSINPPETSKFHQFKIFLNLSYLIVSFSYGCNMYLIMLFNAVIVDFAIDKGLSLDESTYLLMALNGSDLSSRLLLGWITDGGYMTRTHFCSLSFLMSAVSTLCISWSNGIVSMMLAIGLQGIAVGSLFTTCPGLIPQYVEKEYHTMAVASAALFLAPFCAVTPSLIGYFRDDLGSYNLLMYFLVCISSLNFVLLLILPSLDSWRTKRKTAKPET